MKLFGRKPDAIVGPGSRPKSRRWYLLRFRGVDVCIHQFLRPDPPGLHDHHAWNLSIVLAGSLQEERPGGIKVLTRGRVVFRRATTPHRLTPLDMPAWTLFVIGPPSRKWGYWREGKWIPWDRA